MFCLGFIVNIAAFFSSALVIVTTEDIIIVISAGAFVLGPVSVVVIIAGFRLGQIVVIGIGLVCVILSIRDVIDAVFQIFVVQFFIFFWFVTAGSLVATRRF